ncbi:DUF5994 family protein [Nocardiopsis tropica]|uniref:DUF5994 family protein n=1 Tax=Tsukamurella strandjordii TaxID=147577 RepID=UPI0031D7013E
MTHPLSPPIQPGRLHIKPAGSILGAVDGVWWPQSRDLPTEVNRIVATLHGSMAHLERVCYRYSDWDPAPRKIWIESELTRLDGYYLQALDTVRFVGGGVTLTLAVIPPGAETDVAELATLLAMTGATSQSAHAFNVEAIATTSATHQRHAAEREWESEGGHAPPSRPPQPSPSS